MPQSIVPGDTTPLSEQLPPSHTNMFTGIWLWWANLTGPRQENFTSDIFDQERLRRARLVCALLPLIILVVLLLIPSTYPSSPSIWTPIVILSFGSVVIALCNRAAYTTLSPILYVLLVDIALAGFFIFKPTPALNSTNMTTFDLSVLTILIGGIILPKALIPLTGILQVFLILIIFFLRPHDPSLVALIQFAGNPYVALAPTFVLLLVGTWLAWLQAWSIERALIRASQAEELAEARAELSQQAAHIAQHNQQLEEGIAAILEVHRQIATGNLTAPVPVQEDHELWQIGHALNMLLMRLQQQAYQYRTLYTTCQEIDQLIRIVDTQNTGGIRSLPPVSLRTPLAQRLFIVLNKQITKH